MPGGKSVTRHVEVERKFDVDGSISSPSFADVVGVTRVDRLAPQSLDAVYFDTAAHDLAARRITLRHRTGGTDGGWHLKLPAGRDVRTEVRLPSGTDDEDGVPTAIREMVLGIVRDRALIPVARIMTIRNIQLLHGAGGTVLAEFCDDHVSASALGAPEQGWREWELELVEPGSAVPAELLDRLGNELLDTGATPAGHTSKLARALGRPADTRVFPDPVHQAVTEQVDELLMWDRAVRDDADDAVHQARVTIRKIRSLLQASAGSFGLSDQPDHATILDELRWLAGLLGVARDAEVLAQRYRQALDRLPAELIRGRVGERLVDGAARGYRSGLHRSLDAMRSARYFRLLDSLDALVAAAPTDDRSAIPAAPVTIEAAYRRVRRATKAAQTAGSVGSVGRDEALHRIRKAAKRLRYTAAATGASPVADRAKAIQSLLGDHQDSVVSRAHLLREATTAHAAGEDTFTYGLLYQQEDDLAGNCRQQLDQALADLADTVRELG